MKPALRYLAVGAAAYLLILVVTFPADYLRDTLQDRLPGLVLGDVGGSVFSGQSQRVSYMGQELGPVEWRIRPSALLMLRVEYRLQFSSPDNNGHVNIGIRSGSDVYGHGLDMRLVPDRLVNTFSPVAIQTRGAMNLVLERFELTSAGARGVTGTALWQDAAIESPLVLPLGDVELALESRDEDLVATVTRGGDLGLSGEMLLQPGDRYVLDLVLRPNDSVGSEVQALLETTIPRHPAGGYQLKTNGSF